jgi:RNA polymerase sigma-70 factor (ECF subfamily)
MERNLVERAQHGDRQAFSELAFEISDRLFALAHRILRDFDAAGDALQLTLVRAWRDLPTLREPARFNAWVHRLLVHACQDELRRLRRRAPILRTIATDDRVDDSSAALAVRDELERAFARLSADQRAVIVLQYYRDLSLPEIADLLGVPAGTARSRLHYARRAMRAAIEAERRLAAREGRPA